MIFTKQNIRLVRFENGKEKTKNIVRTVKMKDVNFDGKMVGEVIYQGQSQKVQYVSSDLDQWIGYLQ